MEIKRLYETLGGSGKFILYGPSGSGKTRSLGTLPNDETLIISAEKGLRSLKKVSPDMAVAEVKTMDDVTQVYMEILKGDYPYIAIDSLTKIADFCLAEEMAKTKHGMQAYGAMNERMTGMIDSFIDLPYTVIMIAQEDRVHQELVGTLDYVIGPAIPGKKYQTKLAYFFDFVFCMRTKKEEDGSIMRAFQCGLHGDYLAKSRDPDLDTFEDADWQVIFDKLEDV